VCGVLLVKFKRVRRSRSNEEWGQTEKKRGGPISKSGGINGGAKRRGK